MSDDNTVAALRAALQVSPDNAPLRRHLAATLVAMNRLDDARSEYQEALRVEPGHAPTLLELGRILHRLGRNEEAAARLSEALRLSQTQSDGERAPVQLEMARVLLALGQREKAQRFFTDAMNGDPTLRDVELERELFPPAPQTEPQKRSIPAGPDTTDADVPADDRPSDTETILIGGLGIPLERPALTFADVGGMETLKEQVRIDIIYPFQHPEIYAAYGKKIGGGILLYGPPGCGKTYMARATAGEVAARFIAVGIEDVMNMWMGESERRLHAIFEAARKAAPAILFFDELEALAGKRSGMDHSPHYRALVNQFLAELDGAKGDNENLLIVGATNTPWHVDPAFRRPGRFDKIIFVPPPDMAARVEILKLHCRNKPVENLNYELLAAQMKLFSGADIGATCDAAAEIGLREALRTGKMRPLGMADFYAALKTIHPTTHEWLDTARNYVMYSNQSGLYDPIASFLQKGME